MTIKYIFLLNKIFVQSYIPSPAGISAVVELLCPRLVKILPEHGQQATQHPIGISPFLDNFCGYDLSTVGAPGDARLPAQFFHIKG
jgi:hypothetical protein